MRIIIIGLGSMGKRRTRVLSALDGIEEIRGFDIKPERRAEAEQEFGIKTFSNIDDVIAWGPGAAIISTPPLYHTEYSLHMGRAGIPFFVEASVIDDGLDKVDAVAQESGVVGVPSSTMRFHPRLRQVHQLIHEDKILGEPNGRLTFTYHMGQYLPDWHPDEPIQNFYVSDPQVSATREMVCFENVWLSWLFGTPKSIDALKTKITALDANIDDVFQMLIAYGSGTIGTVLIDVVTRIPYRSLRVISEDGILEWDGADDVLRFNSGSGWHYYSKGKSNSHDGGNFIGETMYVEEMKAFLSAVRGDKGAYSYNFSDDQIILSLLRGADTSHADGRRQIPGKV